MIEPRLYLRVLARFKYLIIVGVIAAFGLSMLSFVRVSFKDGKPDLIHRQAEIFEGDETLLVTQSGFPEGRTVFPQTDTQTGPVSPYADPNRLTGLATFYSRLAMSDAVRALILKRLVAEHVLPVRAPGPIAALTLPIAATPVSAGYSNQGALPLLTISGRSKEPRTAVLMAQIASAEFRKYLDDRQAEAGIPEGQRIVLTVINRATAARVVVPRNKTVPLLVFVAVLGATFGAALILERLRPRVPVVEQVAAARDVAA